VKKILLICYHFPPSLAVGGKRIAAFARHLPSFGWEPSVLTIREELIQQKDETAGVIPPCRIYRTPVFPTIRDAYLRTKRYFRKWNGGSETSGLQAPISEKRMTDSGQSSGIRSLARSMTTLALSFPDFERGWVIPSLSTAIRRIRSEKFDWILTTSPPHSTHVIGLVAKKLTGVRWVADFRDPFLATREEELTSLFGKEYVGIGGTLECSIIRNADLVLTTTEAYRDALRKHYGLPLSEKIVCLTNGFDAEAFPDREEIRKFDRFTISYTGNLYQKRTPEPLFEAIAELVGEGRITPEEISVKLVGVCDYAEGSLVEILIRKYGLENIVETTPPVSSRKALEIVMSSHIALLIAPEQPLQIPAKAFEYLGSGSPILALSEEGATRDLLASTGAGKTFTNGDVAGIKTFILETMKIDGGKVVEGNRKKIKEYERKNLVLRLSSLLGDIDTSFTRGEDRTMIGRKVS
jgi:glycosyltransferase involved in cell wall biosynthesis